MDQGPPPPLAEPPRALLLRGCLGIALAAGGLVLGGDWGRGLLIVGTATTAWGAVLFAREALAYWRGRGR